MSTIMARTRTTCRRAAILALLVLPLLAGCAAHTPRSPDDLQSRADAELARYREGLRSFANGEYGKAGDIFEPLTSQAVREDLRQQALYSLAMARLAAADDAKSFYEAVALWQSWLNASSWSDKHPDPRLMAPIMERLRPPFMDDCTEPDDTEEPRAKPPQPPKQPAVRIERQDPECRKTLKAMEKKVKTLQEQLNALEAISQEIREKKREMYGK